MTSTVIKYNLKHKRMYTVCNRLMETGLLYEIIDNGESVFVDSYVALISNKELPRMNAHKRLKLEVYFIHLLKLLDNSRLKLPMYAPYLFLLPAIRSLERRARYLF